MSRIGNKPIALIDGVKISVTDRVVNIEGPNFNVVLKVVAETKERRIWGGVPVLMGGVPVLRGTQMIYGTLRTGTQSA